MAIVDGLRNRGQESSREIFLQRRDRSVSHPSISDLRENNAHAQLVTSRNFVDADDDHSHVPYEQSCGLMEIERKKIRRIFQEWKRTGMTANKTNSSFINNNSRPDWLGETKQERVRIIRECIETRKDPHEYQSENVKMTIQKLCSRQALVDLLKKAERERREEIEFLLKQRPVSWFSHRKLIQSLLKSRFLRNDRVDESPKSATSTEGELSILRRRHSVSGLRKGFLLQSDYSVRLQTSTENFSTTSKSENVARLVTDRGPVGYDEILHGCHKQAVGIDMNCIDGINPVPELVEQMHEEDGDDYQETLQNGIGLEELPNQGSDPVQELQTFDEDDYPLEIQELLRRHIVSTLLNSSFCVRLNQLLRSYVEKQAHASSKFDPPEKEDFDGLSEDDSVDQASTVENPPLDLNYPSKPPPPSWQDRRSEIDWDIINDMKNDIARLQLRMSCLQEMVESCMDMQLKLQRLMITHLQL